jgi:Protein of unknown function (DUF3618)
VEDRVADKSEQRSIEDVQAEIDETRARLVDNLEALKAEANPKVLGDKAKTAVMSTFINPDTGELRRERVIAVASVAVGLLLLRRGMKARGRKRELRRLGEVVWVPVPRASVKSELIPVSRTAAELGPVAPQFAIAAA